MARGGRGGGDLMLSKTLTCCVHSAHCRIVHENTPIVFRVGEKRVTTKNDLSLKKKKKVTCRSAYERNKTNVQRGASFIKNSVQ